MISGGYTMPRWFRVKDKRRKPPSYFQLSRPIKSLFPSAPPLVARGNKKLELDFEQQLDALILFHLDEHVSGSHLLQVIEEDSLARQIVGVPRGIPKSTFFEAINSRGLEQLLYLFGELYKRAAKVLPKDHAELGELVGIDGSLIDATLTMRWADYKKDAKKAKVHLDFDLNRSIPRKISLTDGNAGERPFAMETLSHGQTGVMDRGYQCHKNFDLLQEQNKYFVCRILEKTAKNIVREDQVPPKSMFFFDGLVLLGLPSKNLSEKPVRLVGYKIAGKTYWIATNRFDLSADQIATIYKLRWEIEKFFAWWKRHLRVYHLIARSRYGLMVQILGGLITYLLLAIFCHEQYQEKVNIKRVRQLRIQIQREARSIDRADPKIQQVKEQMRLHAKT
jgi:Transposase DDE domain